MTSASTEPRRLLAIPILHPAYILRGKFNLETAQVEYLRQVAEILSEGAVPDVPDVRQKPEGANLEPTLQDLEDFVAGPIQEGLTVDVEAAGPHPICIGFCRLADEAYVCVRFRRRGGGPWWDTYDDLYAAVAWCDRILGDPSVPKIMHAGQSYDVEELEAVGFRIEGFLDDTILMANTWMGEMPKGLEFLAGLLCRMPRWKFLVKEGDEPMEKG